MAMKPKLVVVGNGPVGHRFLEVLIDSGAAERFDIVVFGEEPRPAYDRVHLTAWFETRDAAHLKLAGADFYDNGRITLLTNARVTAIDRDAKAVITAAGDACRYDKLVLATGSYPFVPPVPGHERPHCFVYRTIEDLQAIADCAAQQRVGAVVGGGLLGLEAAKALKDLGLKTHVVEFAPRLMAVQVDDGGGKLLRQKIEALGVDVHLGKNTRAIVDGELHFHKMCFTDGQELQTDLIVFSAGIRPRDELARGAGLTVGERGGIAIDDHCRTSDPDIYAIGEVALWGGRIYGLIAPGNRMAQAAAEHIAGSGATLFQGADMSTKLKLMGVDVASIGDAHGSAPDALSYTWIDDNRQAYKKLVVSADRKRLLGAVLVGDATEYGNLLQLALNAIDLPEQPEALILPSTDGAPRAGMGVAALPASAQICSCNNVSKGALVSAIADGAHTLAELKGCTKAGTSCGGCSALVGQVLNAELEKQGVAVCRDLCEHFPHSRQELFHLVRVERIRSFDALLLRHGRGLGCDICKPAVASILASCWNDYILTDSHRGLQDTNDRYLANLQKDGTYSVVPRVPGGEITPDKLIAIANVAKKFNLYTKITGGQRIDLFGARLHELPLIWRELVDAGMESGHAYGKAFRTCKSCVGSTWCRFGVQDSVGMAIALEQRYKGLRAPHKFKMAVSGCTRECAEAQSKDIGVIATDKGWNLYVAGNGGMKPRHADLLAADLDGDTLVRTIDRILMFYIRTADRLQRTSVWLENLEGGLDYLRRVVIDDALGIAQELEQDMAANIANYQCEWKTTIEDPAKVSRFRHFINSTDVDADVVFVPERAQIRPATEAEKAARREQLGQRQRRTPQGVTS